jgi:hypothetical protein
MTFASPEPCAMFSKAFQSVGRMLGLGQPAPVEDERRVWGRQSCNLQTTCRRASQPEGSEHTVHVRNISAGGIGLTVGQNFHPGTLVSIALPGTGDGGEPTHVLACVVRCDPAADAGRFEMGCTFAGVLDDDDLARFGARRSKAGPEDKRHWVRFGCHARARYQVVRTPVPTALAEAQVRDISAGGISLEVREGLGVGDLLSVDLYREEEFLLTTLASVVRTEVGQGGVRIVGCNFIRELPEELLARLG